MDTGTTPRPGDLVRVLRIGIADPGERLRALIGTTHRVLSVHTAPSAQPLVVINGAAIFCDELEIVERAEAGDR